MHVWREWTLAHLRDVKITSTSAVFCPKSCDEGLNSTQKRRLTLKNVPMSISNCYDNIIKKVQENG